MIISMARTTPAWVLLMKQRTRRSWAAQTINQYAQRCEAGLLIDVWSKSPRNGGEPIGKLELIRVTPKPVMTLADLGPEDWELEGFHVLQALGERIDKETPVQLYTRWRDKGASVTVVDFRVASLNDNGKRLADEYRVKLATAGGPVSLEAALAGAS